MFKLWSQMKKFSKSVSTDAYLNHSHSTSIPRIFFPRELNLIFGDCSDWFYTFFLLRNWKKDNIKGWFSAERLEGTQVFVCEDENRNGLQKLAAQSMLQARVNGAVVVCLANAEGSLVKNHRAQHSSANMWSWGCRRWTVSRNYWITFFHFELCISFFIVATGRKSWTDYPTLPSAGGLRWECQYELKTSESFRWNFFVWLYLQFPRCFSL